MRAPSGRIRFGIAARLFLAFASVAALSVIACLAGWLSYARLSDNLAEIADGHVPALILAGRLSEQGAAIIATAPVLALAASPEEHAGARAGLDERLQSMRAVLTELEAAGVSPETLRDIRPLVEAIAVNLSALDLNVSHRLALDRRNREAMEELRWLHADLIDEAEPLVDDARFSMQIAMENLEAVAARSTPGSQLDILRDESRKAEAVLLANANANLAVGLIGRIATLQNEESLSPAIAFLGETSDVLEMQVGALTGWSDSVTLRQVTRRLLEIASPEAGLPALRHQEIAALVEGGDLLAENRELVARLNGAIGEHVQAMQTAATLAAMQAGAAIQLGRRALLVVALLSLAASILIAWAYVHRNLTSRITALAASADAIAAGDLQAPVPLGGSDEVSDMARALGVFRDTAVQAIERKADLQRMNARLEEEVAQHRRTESELREAQDELVQAAKLAALGQLAAGIGHELNQPLAAIRSFAHNGCVLIDRDRIGEARGNLDRISALTTRMAEITNHLKRFARRPEATTHAVAVEDVVESALSLFGRRFEEDEIEIVKTMPVTPLLARAEEIRLEQVFVNLFSNALDAVSESRRRRIEITAEPRERHVVICIRDTGCGIPDAQRPLVFDPFHTTKQIGAGLGLGLSISYNIIKDFGGQLALADTGAEGTTFCVTLERA